MDCPICKLFIDELWTDWNEKNLKLLFHHGCKWDAENKILIILNTNFKICEKRISIREACKITTEYSE